ncbi:hypothetical protein BDA99DRAFT_538920 [Phascolomyces articulosus]|uniref:Uncharacterized protein n=1 Tax=Phascolomyces articulosus TaxID=60185 RepID=A0AAD5PD01_9FUNG|nr:hypothetical protein BDA99DRAFT_538920 [Phascolomyces articulosus]
MWSKRVNAPNTLFTSTRNMSPRQVASKAHSLACKKLDRDEKRRRPSYHIRERVLLNNTMIKADALLNKRQARTNRRVLAAEDDEVGYDDPPQTQQHHQHYPPHHHSPLAHSNMEEDEEPLQEQEQSLPPQQPVMTAEIVSPQPLKPEQQLSEQQPLQLVSTPPSPPLSAFVLSSSPSSTNQAQAPLLPTSIPLPPSPPTTPPLLSSSSITSIPLDLPTLDCRILVSHNHLQNKFTCTAPAII